MVVVLVPVGSNVFASVAASTHRIFMPPFDLDDIDFKKPLPQKGNL